jgi:hypothetical protein
MLYMRTQCTHNCQVVCEYPDRSRTTAQGAFRCRMTERCSSDAPAADVTADVATLLTATTLNDSTLLQLDSLAAATAASVATAAATATGENSTTVTYTSVTPMVTRQNTPRWQGIPPSLLLTPRAAVESSSGAASTARSLRGRADKQSTKASSSGSKLKGKAKGKSKSPKRSSSKRSSKSPKKGASSKGIAKRKGKV